MDEVSFFPSFRKENVIFVVEDCCRSFVLSNCSESLNHINNNNSDRSSINPSYRMESYNRLLIRYVSRVSVSHKFPGNFGENRLGQSVRLSFRVIPVLWLMKFASRIDVTYEKEREREEMIRCLVFQQEEKELSPEEAEFIQKIKSKMWVKRSLFIYSPHFSFSFNISIFAQV